MFDISPRWHDAPRRERLHATRWLFPGLVMAAYPLGLFARPPESSHQSHSDPTKSIGVVETWESAASSRLTAGPWQLQSGDWGSIGQQDSDGTGRKYVVPAGQVSQLKQSVCFAELDHVVLQGWLYDSGQGTHSTLGLASADIASGSIVIRIGATGQATYRIQYANEAQGQGAPRIHEIDTAVAAEAGWHFLRLDLVRDLKSPRHWQGTWRIWNADRTDEKRGTFPLTFDAASVAWITLGATTPSAAEHAWDDISVGSLRQVGPPPTLPDTSKFTLSASSQLDGWEVIKLTDGDAQTVFSSHGHGDQSEATEWVAIDFGRVHTVNLLQLTPRAGGLGFPVDYEIQTSVDGSTWNTVPGQTHTGQSRPESVVTHLFAAPVRARAIRVHATRLGSDNPDGAGQHYLQLADLEVPRLKLDIQPWISPAELRHKSINSTGTFSAVSLEREDAPTPKYLAEHPEYLAHHPFDGVTIPILIDGEYTRSQGLISQRQFAFHEIGMSSLPIPWSAVAESVEQLRRVQWRHCTDNFMWYGVSNFSNERADDGDRVYPVDPQSAEHWQVVVGNAAVAARLARESGLKGFLVDTEQYTKYPTGDRPEYPWGRGEAAVWKERGRQWIEAVQREFPNIELQFFFSWGDEYRVWPNYQNLVPFMNGVLAGIEHPARIVHAFESTFWNGQARETPPGTIRHYPGDREPFAFTRHAIRNIWRKEADAPGKYDDFVDVGMAAWMESDPWNLWPGQVSGYQGPTVPLGRSAWPSMPWSNLAATLAYSDKYVWTWCASCNYPATWQALNPYLASIANQTFNTGTEAVHSFQEDFAHDPLARGWYFDFSFMEIGRRTAPDDGPPQMVMTKDAVAYAWSEKDHAVHVRGHWTRGEFGQVEGLASPQRRRFVHPIAPRTRQDDIQMEIDFTVDSFGEDASNPILLGLFHSTAPTDAQSVCLRVNSQRELALQFAGDGTPWSLPLPIADSLAVERPYRVIMHYQGATRRVSVSLIERSTRAEISRAMSTLPATTGPFVVDEAGVAQREEAFAATAAQSYRLRFEGFQFNPPPQSSAK